MIFIEGFPKDTGADDFMDSSRLVGMMAIVDHPQTPDLSKYLIGLSELIRCPITIGPNDMSNVPANFSRDQLLPLIAGMKHQGRDLDCVMIYEAHKGRGWRCQNGDWLSPSHRLHLKLCANLKASWWEYLWLRGDILFNAYWMPLEEQNQIISMCTIAGKKYLQMWTYHNFDWRKAVLNYWGTWRKEQDLATNIVHEVEKRTKV